MTRSTDPQPAHYRSDMRCTSEDNVGFLVKQVYNSLNKMLDQDMAPLGLTAMQWRPIAMLLLGRADTSAELARLNGVDTGAMTRTLDRLEAKGLIRRTRSLEDRRVIRIELTELGHASAEQIPASISRALNQHLRGVSAEEHAKLIHFLKRMLANGSAPLSAESPHAE